LQELYKQVPYISDYQPHVEMQKVDGEQGYGVGHVEIQNQTEAPAETDEEALDATGVRTVRIPFVVNNKKLSPFDLLITDDSKMLPLTENRLRQAIFRPQAFDVTSRTPGDQSMIGQLYPPYRQNYGFGGGGIAMNATGGMGMGKIGSPIAGMDSDLALSAYVASADDGEKQVDPEAEKRAENVKAVAAESIARDKEHRAQFKEASILDAILPTINQADHTSFCGEVEKCAANIFANRRTAFASIEKVVATEPSSMTKMASWEGLVRPSVVQIQHIPSGYIIKEASHLLWNPKSQLVSRGEVVERFGTKIAADVDTSGSVTVAEGAEAEGGDTQTDLEPVTEFGLYKVRDEGGGEHVGFVIPQLIDTDGSMLPLQLFTNGTVSATQSEIMGEVAGTGGNLPSGEIGGHGAFYTIDAEGQVQMTVPLEIGESFSMPNEPAVFNAETFDGRPVEVSVQPNISGVMSTEEGRMLVPDSWSWIPLGDSQAVSLVGGDEAVEMETEGETEEKESHVIVRADPGGEIFSFSGRPVEKLASTDKTHIDVDRAMFLLAGLGTHQGYGAEKLAMAAYSDGPVAIKTGRALELRDELVKEAQAKASDFLQKFPQIKLPHMLKEAANFPDPSIVDTVLSLGFVNPENILTFVSYLPDIEGVQSKLCELLLAVRLGLQNIPQPSLERAVRSLEEAIEGLKILAFQGS
jgi:hypothetical protein